MHAKTSDLVMETVWPWWRPPKEASPEKTGRRAAIQAGILAAIGAGLFFGLHHRAMGGAVWTLGALIGLSGLLAPRVFKAIERFGQRLGAGTGLCLTYLLLVPFYLLVFAPAHAALALRGKDPMNRRFPCPDATCWTPKKSNPNLDHYQKQFS